MEEEAEATISLKSRYRVEVRYDNFLPTLLSGVSDAINALEQGKRGLILTACPEWIWIAHRIVVADWDHHDLWNGPPERMRRAREGAELVRRDYYHTNQFDLGYMSFELEPGLLMVPTTISPAFALRLMKENNLTTPWRFCTEGDVDGNCELQCQLHDERWKRYSE